MKIGIISDTHDRLESLKKAIEIFSDEKVEMIVHCGDWVSPFTLGFFDVECQKAGLKVPVHSVFGNNEGDIIHLLERNSSLKNPIHFSSKDTLELDLNGKKAVVYHGHDITILSSFISSKLYDVVFTGHTHEVRNEKVGNVLVVNPGTTCLAINSKIINYATIAVYDSKTNVVKVIKFA